MHSSISLDILNTHTYLCHMKLKCKIWPLGGGVGAASSAYRYGVPRAPFLRALFTPHFLYVSPFHEKEIFHQSPRRKVENKSDVMRKSCLMTQKNKSKIELFGFFAFESLRAFIHKIQNRLRTTWGVTDQSWRLFGFVKKKEIVFVKKNACKRGVAVFIQSPWSSPIRSISLRSFDTQLLIDFFFPLFPSTPPICLHYLSNENTQISRN